MVINKYSSSTADVRLRNAIADYPSRDEVDQKLTDLKGETSVEIGRLEGKVNENEKKTNDILERIFLCIKIIFVALILVLLFTVICVISYFDLKSKMDKVLSSSIENVWTIDNAVYGGDVTWMT